jgi:hypothetical protein
MAQIVIQLNVSSDSKSKSDKFTGCDSDGEDLGMSKLV